MSGQLVAYQAPSESQIEILRTSVCKDLTNDQLKFFLAVCQRRGLDPFANEVYAIVRKVKNRDTNTYEPKMVIQTGIDGFRQLAERSGEYDGQDEPEWDCEPGAGAKCPKWAKVTVYRASGERRVAITAKVFWSEFAQQGGLWDRMPWHMLAKCAEVQALRKGFPRQLGGIYEPSEPFHDGAEQLPAAAGAAAVQAQLDKPAMPPAFLADWNRAVAAFAGHGVDFTEMLTHLKIASPNELTAEHLQTLRLWYDEINKPRE